MPTHSTAGFNGTFTFSSLCLSRRFRRQYLRKPAPGPGMSPVCRATAAAAPPPRRQPVVITQGSPNASVTTYDAGLYVQDDWRVKPNITFSYGFRFETQNDIRDHADLAPRLGIAWGVHGRSAPPIVVIRGGLGYFIIASRKRRFCRPSG